MINAVTSDKKLNYWDPEVWKAREPIMTPLIVDIEEVTRQTPSVPCSEYVTEGKEGLLNTDYVAKTRSIIEPEVISYWKEKGLTCYYREAGQVFWVVAAKENPDVKQPVLLKMHNGDYNDPFWAMKLMACYEDEFEKCIEQGYILLYVVVKPDVSTISPLSRLIVEVDGLFPFDTENVYLNVDEFLNSGKDLNKYSYRKYDDRLKTVVEKYGHKVVNISGAWQTAGSGLYGTVIDKHNCDTNFDGMRFKESPVGDEYARMMVYDYEYDEADDPKFAKELEKYGMKLDVLDYNGERWMLVTALNGYTEKVPLVNVFSECSYVGGHASVTSITNYFTFCKMAADGKCAVLFFALESADDNELLCDLIEESIRMYPIDRSRMYVVGHSHNGYYALEFGRRHPELIAAVSELGNYPGVGRPVDVIQEVRFTDEMVEDMRIKDIPVINICGYNEPGYLPLNMDARYLQPGAMCGSAADIEGRAVSWQRRQRSCDVKVSSIEEIKDTINSDDKVKKLLGVTCDRTEIRNVDSFDHYIADCFNSQGKAHFRLVSIENTPHTITPYMQILSWEFWQKFARDQETLKIIDL